MASTPDGRGYWMLARDGGLFTYGDASFYGSAFGHVIGTAQSIVASPTGRGYWIQTTSGQIFRFGDAVWRGAVDHIGYCAAPTMVGLARSADGAGYFAVANNGQVFTFGDAQSHGAQVVSGANPAVAVLPVR